MYASYKDNSGQKQGAFLYNYCPNCIYMCRIIMLYVCFSMLKCVNNLPPRTLPKKEFLTELISKLLGQITLLKFYVRYG